MKNTKKTLRLVLTLTALSFVTWGAGKANAKDLPVPDENMILLSGGVLCDTEDELTQLITGIHLNGGSFPSDAPAGCGMFAPEMPVPMLSTPLYWYETPSESTLITRFVYPPNGWTQYGWIAYQPNPDYVPAAARHDT